MPLSKYRTFRNFSEWLLLGGGMLAAGAALGWASYREHQAVSMREQQHLSAQVRMIDANLFRQLDALDRTLRTIRGELPQWQAEEHGAEQIGARLAAFAQAMVGVRNFAIINQHGVITASSKARLVGMDVTEQPYFAALKRTQGGDLLYVNRPVKNSQNQWLLILSRKLFDTQGHFAGVVIAFLDSEELQIMLSSARYTDDMTATLAHGDGILFMTLPASRGPEAGTPLAAGTTLRRLTASQPVLLAEEVQGESKLLVAARWIQPDSLHMNRPLLVSLSRSLPAMYAEWRATTIAWWSGFVVLMSGAVLALIAVHRRRRELLLNARRSERLLRERNRALEAANHMLENQRAQLQTMVFVDGLTGIANRRHFDEVISREWAHCHRTKSPIALLMLDLDNFKQLNDHYGHQAGDECLQRVAQVLQLELYRAHDLVARYGGEEFVCLLPECELTDARIKAEHIRTAVEALAIPNVRATAAAVLTVSVGVACCVPQTADQADSLIALADAALYRAKGAGRNQVACAATSLLSSRE